MSLKIGSLAEEQARDYLISQGLKLRDANYRCRMGEIDLIMRDGDYLVFVEVRARSSSVFGGAVASVTYSKQQKLIKTASLYLSVNKIYDKQPIRFDVLGMEGVPPHMTWIKNAFGSDY
jgi:putative endonuclease